MGYYGAQLVGWFEGEHIDAACLRLAERGGTVLKGAARQKAPVDTGHLRDSFVEHPVRRRVLLGTPVYEVEVENMADYSLHVEHGTGLYGPNAAKYLILPKRPGGVLHWKDPYTGEDRFAAYVWHPGSPGAHFFLEGAAITEHTFPAWARPILEEWARVQGQNRTFVVYGARF